MAPATGGVRERAAAGVVESRVGAGPGYFGYTPGNIRVVRDFPAAGIVVRRSALLELDDAVALRDLVAAVTRRGDDVLYTPESVVVTEPAPLFAPHLRVVWARGVVRGARLRRGQIGRPTVFGALLAALVVLAILLCAVFLDLSAAEAIVLGVVAAYVLAVLVAAAAAALRHQSLAVGWLVVLGIVSTHVVSLAALARGLVAGR
jgi:hypothetical protein